MKYNIFVGTTLLLMFGSSVAFTVNVAANLALLRTTDLGIVIGLGYNF